MPVSGVINIFFMSEAEMNRRGWKFSEFICLHTSTCWHNPVLDVSTISP